MSKFGTEFGDGCVGKTNLLSMLQARSNSLLVRSDVEGECHLLVLYCV